MSLPNGSGWCEAVRDAAPFAKAAEALGMTKDRDGYRECPSCKATRRGSSDARAPVGVTNDGKAWCCFACHAKGDVVDLVALARAGGALASLGAPLRAEVRAWCAARGWCSPAPELSTAGKLAVELLGSVPPKGDPRWKPIMTELARRLELQERTRVVERPPALPPPRRGSPAREVDKDRDAVAPPVEEVAALWAACRHVDGTGCAALAGDWITYRRGLDTRALAALDLVRVLPDRHPWPAWMPWMQRPPVEWLSLYPLAVPMYDAGGALRLLRFRAVTEIREVDADANPAALRWRPRKVEPKGIAPRGARLAGLLLADPPGRAMLRGESGGDLGSPGEGWDGVRVVICEGEPDTWTAATIMRKAPGRTRDGRTWATLGVVAGSWTAELAARVPDGAEVALWTHHDAAGDKYATRIADTLAARCKVVRSPRPEDRDDG